MGFAKLPARELIVALHGPHNYLPTPFHANGDLDAEGMQRNVAYHVEHDARPMTAMVCGGYGEGLSLSLEEHEEAVAAAVAGAQGRFPVMAGVIGGYTTCKQMAPNAQAAGADALLIFPPRGDSHSRDGFFAFYRDIVNAVSIGTMILPTGQHDFWPDLIGQLAELDNLIGFFAPLGPRRKSYVDMGKAVFESVSKPMLWVAENEPAAADCFSSGVRAYSTAVAALVPAASWRFFDHGVAGETEQMNDVLTHDVDPIIAIRGYGGIGGPKVALEAMGRAGGPVRPPGTQVAPEDRPKIVDILRAHPETQAKVSPPF